MKTKRYLVTLVTAYGEGSIADTRTFAVDALNKIDATVRGCQRAIAEGYTFHPSMCNQVQEVR